MQINYYINGIEVQPPINAAELSVELNYDKGDTSSQSVSITEVEFGIGSQTDGSDAATLINEHRLGGLSGSIGVFEGLPYKVELTKDNTTYVLFDGYLNTSTALWECDRVIVGATEKGNIDWLTETAESISFAYLFDETGNNDRNITPNALITNADFISVPYVLSELPDTREALLAAISLTFLFDTIATQLEEVIEMSVGLANPLDFLGAVKLVLRIIYLVGLFLMLFVTIQRIINLLIQKTKYHDVMKVTTLCEKGAAHFGLTFESSILYDDTYKGMVIMPKKYSHESSTVTYSGGGVLGGAKDILTGFFTANDSRARGYYDGTFGQLLRDLKEVFNGKIIIDGTVLKFEREDFNNSAYNYVLPPVDDTDYKLNFSELYSNYTVEFQTDINDKNTLQDYEGTYTQVIQSPKAVINKDMVLMTGLQSRSIPFARATRKTDLTSVEKTINFLAPLIDGIAKVVVAIVNSAITVIDTLLNTKLGSAVALVNLVGPWGYAIIVAVTGETSITGITQWIFDQLGIPNPVDFENIPKLEYKPIGNSIKERYLMLKMENDFISVPKLFLIDETTKLIRNESEAAINSEFLYKNYHFLRTFVTDKYTSAQKYAPNGNQKKIYNVSGVPFCFEDYELMLNNNRLQDSEGNNGELISCKWNVENETAEIDYFIRERYTNNIKEDIITLDGK